MCEITINIDKEKLHKINPIFKDTVTIRNWAQHQIDLIINEMTNLQKYRQMPTLKRNSWQF